MDGFVMGDILPAQRAACGRSGGKLAVQRLHQLAILSVFQRLSDSSPQVRREHNCGNVTLLIDGELHPLERSVRSSTVSRRWTSNTLARGTQSCCRVLMRGPLRSSPYNRLGTIEVCAWFAALVVMERK